MTVSGRLQPEIIQRIVRANFEKFRFCYERGRARDLRLEGTVIVHFVINGEGIVSGSALDDTELPDKAVAECIRSTFMTLKFPSPENRSDVSVVYPIMLGPD